MPGPAARTLTSWIGLALLLAACGASEDRARSPRDADGHAHSRDVTPARAKAVPQIQVVYYATDRKAVPLDFRWHVDRFFFSGSVFVLGAIVLLSLRRMTRRRFRWRVRVLALLWAVAVLLTAWDAFWEVRFDHQLAERVGRYYGAERGTYGGQGGLPLELGRMEVSVPPDHTEGVLERPDPLKGEFREDPMKHWLIARLDVRHDHAAFFTEVAAEAVDDDALLVFVHGYNTDFEEGAHRTAQIAWDLKFKGPVIYYSWPSAGELDNYEQDDQNETWTRAHLKAFLQTLASAVPDKNVHLIAHSMGNRALTRALMRMRLDELEAREAARERGEDPGPRARDPFREVVLAAPDIDASVFRDDIVPGIRGAGRRITLYASENDEALQASRKWNVDKPRAGQAGRESIVVVDGVETVDVSRVSRGHSYIGTSGFVLGALRKVFAGEPRPIADRTNPDQPLWEEPVTNAQGKAYWLMRTGD